MLKKTINNLKNNFLEEFSSVRLAVTLFIFLAITTLVGTVLPEEPLVGSTELIKRYGVEKYKLLRSLGLTDVFHSWWYLALLTTLGINLTIASFRKVFPKWYLAFSWPCDLNEEDIRKLPTHTEIDLVNSERDLKMFAEILKKKKYRAKLNSDGLLAVRGGWHKLGASVTHIGIMILLIGCAISIFTGFNGLAQVSETEGFYLADLGQTTNQIKSIESSNWIAPISKMPIWFGKVPPYLIKVNKTWKESYNTGQPKQWFSDLSVLDQSKKELARKVIYVNNPLEFMGLDVYQSNWGRFINVGFNNKLVTLPLENFRNEEVVFLPLSDDVGLKLKVAQNLTSDMLELYSVSRENMRQKHIGSVKVNQKLQLGPININYLGTQTLTGLQFKSNPGWFLICPALFFIVAGVFIAFGTRRQIWALVNSSNNKIIIGGDSDRHRGKFYEEFEKLILDFSNH